MSTLSKLQRLRASSKEIKKNSSIICLEITRHKVQKPHPVPRRENLHQKCTVSAGSRATVWVLLCGLRKTLADNRSINKWQVTCSVYNLFDSFNFCKVYMGSFLDTKFNFCFKFVNKTTFFVTSWNTVPDSWCKKRSSLNAVSSSVDISWLKLGFVS